MSNPILKWAGGKRQILADILERFPGEYNAYHEPFVGAGGLFFHLESARATINDTNPRLINLYIQIRDNLDKVIEIASQFKDPYGPPDPSRPFDKLDRKGRKIPNYYYQQRALFNRRPYNEPFDPAEEAALFLYLNRTCYNGLYRENADGVFNVPIGRYKNPVWVREADLRKAAEILRNTEIYNEDFTYILKIADEGDLVYFDPPYEPMSRTANFTDYNAKGFGREDQIRLLECVKKLDGMGVKFILSNSGVMYDLYRDAGFKVDIIRAKRAINSDGKKRGKINEILVRNYD